MEFQFDSSFGIIIYNGKLLLVLRDTKEKKPLLSDPNTWSFIGGGADTGEEPIETYLREVKEEINIELSETKFLFVFTLADRSKYVYYNELTDDQVKSLKLGTEGQKLSFFSFDEIDKIPLARTTQAFVKEHKELLQQLLTA